MIMENKLAEFRARRRREEFISKTKDTFNNIISMNFVKTETSDTTSVDDEDQMRPLIRTPSEVIGSSAESITSEEEVEEQEEAEVEDGKGRWFQRANWYLMFLLWLTLLCVAFQLQLALAYSLISALVFIFLNTSTQPRRAGVPSAYSVFNPNCEAIDGTLNAEQFEREIRFGPGSVR